MATSQLTLGSAANLATFQTVLSAYPGASQVSVDTLTITFKYLYTKDLAALTAVAYALDNPADVAGLYATDGTLAANRTVTINDTFALTIEDENQDTSVVVQDEDVTITAGDGMDLTSVAVQTAKTEVTVTGGHMTIVGLGTFADDAAAASGGVPFNGLYKTASDVVMIRPSS